MSLTETQRAFATSREPFPCFCGGFGSGKTAAAIARAMALKAHFKDCSVAYYLPTFPLVEDIAFERFPALCERKGWAYRLRKGNSPFIEFPGSGRIVFRTMENVGPIRLETRPELGESLAGVRARIDALRPTLQRLRSEVPQALERIEVPRVRVELGSGMEL